MKYYKDVSGMIWRGPSPKSSIRFEYRVNGKWHSTSWEIFQMHDGLVGFEELSEEEAFLEVL